MNELMQRRRALLGIEKETPGVEINTLSGGTGLMINENGVATQYIYLGNIETNAIIARDRLYGNARRMATSNDQYDYDGTELDNWLSTTFIGYFDTKVQNALSELSLTYYYNNSSTSKTIRRKVFCSSVYMSRTTLLNSFKEYYGITTNSALVGKTSDGVNKPWWYCDQAGANCYRAQYTDGNLNGWPASNSTAVWVRPFISVKSSAKVILDNGVYYLRG